MTTITKAAEGKFTSLFTTIRRALDQVEARLDEAVDAAKTDDIIALATARKTLKQQLFQIRELEIDYQASAKGPSEAEMALSKGADEAKGFLRSMKKVADTLDSVAKIAATLTRLLRVFP